MLAPALVLLCAAPQDAYREAFELGLEALESDQREAAAAHFRRAGELAPDGSVWPRYLALAEGREPPVSDDAPFDAAAAWMLSPPRERWGEIEIAAGGERALVLDHLYDVRSGALVARLDHRGGDDPVTWHFERSGAVIVGRPRTERFGALDLRDARTGEPLGPAAIDPERAVTLATRFAWYRGEAPPALDGELRAATYALAGGTLVQLVDEGPPGSAAGSGGAEDRFGPHSPQAVLTAPHGPGGRRRAVVVEASGEVSWFDPGGGGEAGRCALSPAPLGEPSWAALCGDGELLALATTGGLQVHHLSTGAQAWSRRERGVGGIRLSPDGERLLYLDPDLHVLDVRTGAAARGAWTGTWATDLEVLAEDREHVWLGCRDGSVRRVALATGETAGSSREQHGLGSAPRLQALTAGRLASIVDGASAVIHGVGTEAIRVLTRLELEPRTRVLALGPDGARLLAHGPDEALALVELESGLRTVLDVPAATGPAAFSADGAQLALLTDGTLRLLECASGRVLAERAIQPSDHPGPLRFHGEASLLVAWANEIHDEDPRPPAGLEVLALPGLEVRARLPSLTWDPFGGYIGALLSAPEVGLAAFSISSSGTVSAFRGEPWAPVWSVDYEGGTPATLRLEHAPGSRRLCISGMTDHHARVVDVKNGETLAGRALEGCYRLREVPGGCHLVALRRGRLTVIDGVGYEELRAREEGPDGAAWILRGGGRKLVAPGAGPLPPSLLVRDRVSRPADCFEPWLLDPLGLAPARLDRLPEPPRILEGPERALFGGDGSTRLEVRCPGATALEIEVAGRPVRAVPIDAEGRASVEVAAPWPADVVLRARARGGARSAPWRVHIRAAD